MSGRVCEFPGCGRPYHSKGVCNGHRRQRARGEELTPLWINPYGPICSFPDCGRPHCANGLCNGHWQQLRKGQELWPLGMRRPPQVCASEGCQRPHDQHGLCAGHRAQQLRGRELSPLQELRSGRVCACGNPLGDWVQGDSCRPCLENLYHHLRRLRVEAQKVDPVTKGHVWIHSGGICHLCGELADPRRWELEHLIPVAHGGLHSWTNCHVAHPECHGRKPHEATSFFPRLLAAALAEYEQVHGFDYAHGRTLSWRYEDEEGAA